jgi:tetratricopeptide (TPR) repeat protein
MIAGASIRHISERGAGKKNPLACDFIEYSHVISFNTDIWPVCYRSVASYSISLTRTAIFYSNMERPKSDKMRLPGALIHLENRPQQQYISPAMPMDDTELTADALLKRADELFQIRNYAVALDQYQAAAGQAREEFNRPIEVEALSQIARVHLVMGNTSEGVVWLDRASVIANDSDQMGWSRFLGVRGRFEWRTENLEAARETFDEMYTYCSNNSLWSRAVDAANMNAIVSDTPEDQISWSRRGIEMAEKVDADNWLGPLWNNLAATYFDIRQYEQALECYIKAREYHWRCSDERSKLLADYQIGMTYRMLAKFEDAGRWLRPVLAWAERLEDPVAIGQAAQDLGEVEIARENKAEGLTLLRKARDAYKDAKYDVQAPEIYAQITERIRQLE